MTEQQVDPTAHYTQALAKGGALLPETRSLLRAWRPDESRGEFTERVLRDDVLGRVTAHRVRDLVRVFTLRFLQPDDTAARHLQRCVEPDAPRQVFSDLVFFYTAQQDDLLRDFTVQRYWPTVRAGALGIRNEDVQRLIAEAHRDGRIRAPWSPEIRRDMAGRVLITLTAFGLLSEDRPSRRAVLPYTPADGSILYLAYLLHGRGVTDAALGEHGDWALFGLEPRDVWNRLEGLVSAGWLIVQRSGQVARISWTYGTVEEMLDVLAGR